MIYTRNSNKDTNNTVTSGYHWLPSQLNILQHFTKVGNPVTKIPKHRYILFPRTRSARAHVRACARIGVYDLGYLVTDLFLRCKYILYICLYGNHVRLRMVTIGYRTIIS